LKQWVCIDARDFDAVNFKLLLDEVDAIDVEEISDAGDDASSSSS
jgi:hypothetical protein